MAKKRVAVLFGGASKDHDVSLRSAYSVLRGLSKANYDVIPIGITKAGRWLYFPGAYSAVANGEWESDSDCCSAVLSPDPLHGGIIKLMGDEESQGMNDYSLHRIDAVFSVLHGKYGECGQIQALCKLSGIGYVGSDFSAANACSDKMLSRLILDKAGIKTAKYYYLERVDIDGVEDKFAEIEAAIGYPMYVKAASCSTSIGANSAKNRDELKAGIKIAFSHHHKIIIEEALYGAELECAVWGSVYALSVSAVAEIRETEPISSKYVLKSPEVFIPADIDENTRKEIEKSSKTAFLALGCKNFARVCFKLTDRGLYCRKVGNMSGFTEDNIFSRLMEKSGYGYSELLDLLIDSAKET
ncbi:MAG: D-alanine--D-alanine ligase [Oscillospiraceae bacterium]|jgi:D-alanine--D-alanine ligase|nr:D-alanine--D-alanine ligase [Oscillospiraceae bacterium]